MKLINGTDVEQVYSRVMDHKAGQPQKSKFVAIALVNGQPRSTGGATRLDSMNAIKYLVNRLGGGSPMVYVLGKDGTYTKDEMTLEEALPQKQRRAENKNLQDSVFAAKAFKATAHSFSVDKDFGGESRKAFVTELARMFKTIVGDGYAEELHEAIDYAEDSLNAEEDM